MADTLQLDLVSPAKLLLSESVGMVVVPGIEGYFGVLPDHMPLLSTLRPGVVTVHENVSGPAVQRFFVEGGFAEVNPKGCTLLVDDAVPVDDITQDAINERQAAAEEQLANASSDEDRTTAEAALAVAKAMADALADAA